VFTVVIYDIALQFRVPGLVVTRDTIKNRTGISLSAHA
jgi:hypothetical protein